MTHLQAVLLFLVALQALVLVVFLFLLSAGPEARARIAAWADRKAERAAERLRQACRELEAAKREGAR